VTRHVVPAAKVPPVLAGQIQLRNVVIGLVSASRDAAERVVVAVVNRDAVDGIPELDSMRYQLLALRPGAGRVLTVLHCFL